MSDAEMPTVELDPASASEGADVGGLESRMLLARAQSKLLGWTPDPVRIGRYRILERLGQGGMGVVYAAHDEELDRKVAVKVLRSELATASGGHARLLREAQATAKLAHVNVVHVYEVGHEGDQVFMAMELIEGDTLRRRLERRVHRSSEIVELFLGAAEALIAAHAHGIVHRDFKPDNVLIGRDGRPRVVDFGLARVYAERHSTREMPAIGPAPSASSSAAQPIDVTRSAITGGTPAYMAPEQHAGGIVDARADQFAFCVALFEALYGRRPFRGSTVTELGISLGRGRPLTVDPRRRGIPPALHRAVLTGLAIDAAGRHPSMEALRDALQAAMRTAPHRRWLPIAAFALASAAVFGASRLAELRTPAAAAVVATPDVVEDHTAQILAASRLPDPIPEAAADDATGMTIHRLANGLSVYIAERPSDPSISAFVAVRAGVGDTPPDEQGLASLASFAIMQGGPSLGVLDATRERPLIDTERALSAALQSVDDDATRGRLLAWLDATGERARPVRVPYEPILVGHQLGVRRQIILGGAGVQLQAEVPPHRFDPWVQTVAEMFRRPVFRSLAATAAQRLEITRWTTQGRLAERTIDEALAPARGRVYDPKLAAETIARVPMAALERHHATYFRPNNTAIILVGNITASAALPVLERHLGDWQPAALPADAFVGRELPPRTHRSIVDGASAGLHMAWAMPPVGHPDRPAVAAVRAAFGGNDGIVAQAIGARDPADIEVFASPSKLALAVFLSSDDTAADLESKILEHLRRVADDELTAAQWRALEARATLDARRWFRSSRNLAIRTTDAFLHGEHWSEVAREISQPVDRAQLVAGARALRAAGMVVVDQQVGAPWSLTTPSLPVQPLQLVLERESEAARAIAAIPSTPAEPRFLVAGSHFEITANGSGQVITARDDGPLFRLSWVWPVGVDHDPWSCDAVRAKLRTLAIAGIDADTLCSWRDTRVTVVGPSERFGEIWPELSAQLRAPHVAVADVRAHIDHTLRSRAETRAHGLWGPEAVHLYALRGTHGIDAKMPDDRTLARDGEVQLARSLAALARHTPDILYAGGAADRLRATLPAPGDAARPSSTAFLTRANRRPILIVRDEPGRPQAEVRVIVRGLADTAEHAVAAQVYEYLGERGVDLDAALVRVEPQPGVPIEWGAPVLHGSGWKCAHADVALALDTALALLRRVPERDMFDDARTRAEADFRAVRVAPADVPTRVHSWGPDVRDDPRVAQWLALPGVSFESFRAYADQIARTPPIISVLADLDQIDVAELRRRGDVEIVELTDITRDWSQDEIGYLGQSLIWHGPD